MESSDVISDLMEGLVDSDGSTVGTREVFTPETSSELVRGTPLERDMGDLGTLLVSGSV
jgi:hypothetical protein